MTRNDTLQCVHEPFGDAYYFGPERLAERYESDPQARKESGYSQSTYRTIFDRIAKENSEVRKLFYFPSFSFQGIFAPTDFGQFEIDCAFLSHVTCHYQPAFSRLPFGSQQSSCSVKKNVR
jgi:hypothetical protein